MKKNFIRVFVAGLAAVAGLSSCTDFLNVEKIGKSTIESFFSEVGGMTAAGEGLHKQMMSLCCGSNSLFFFGEAAGNAVRVNTVDADDASTYIFNYNFKPEYVSTCIKSIWDNGYSVVTAANNIIEFGGNFRDNKALPNEIETCDKVIAWAYYARAMAVFSLVNCFGQAYGFTPDASHPGVPSVTRVPGFDDQIPRNTVAENYARIVADLLKAIELLGPQEKVTDCTHVSTIACEALLARVYLYMGDWDKAAEYAWSVMDKVPLTSRDNYVEMFRNPKANLGAESIFRFDSYGNSTTLLSLYDPTRSHDFDPDPAMLDYFDDDDIRRSLFYYVGEDCEEEGYRGQTFVAVCKHLPYKSISDPDNKHPYAFVSRSSEMYLIHAEAVAKGSTHNLDAAAEDLKAIVARAKGLDVSQVNLTWSSQQDMENLIEKERIRELCYEGHSFFDVKRLCKNMERSATSNAQVTKVEYPDYRFALPINELEMQANDYMVQNEGY